MKVSKDPKITKRLFQKILKESHGSLIKLSDHFLPHHKIDPTTGRIVPPADIHFELDALLRGTVGKDGKNWYNLLAILPRGCAKSTYGNVFFIIWLLLFTNKQYIVMVGATTDSIKGHFETLQHEIKNNKLLHQFGIKPLKNGKANSSSFDLEAPKMKGFEYLTGTREVRIEAYSAGTFPRGLKKGQLRPDMFIIDDLEVQKSGNKPGVENKKYRDEIRKLFNARIVPSGFNEASCQIVMLGTIMSEAMLLYQLYDSSNKGECSPHFKTIKYSMIENYGKENAKSIWKEKMTVEDFDKKMASAKKDGTTNVMYNEYLSQITSPDDEVFVKSDFRYFNKTAGLIEICDENGKPIPEYDRIKIKDTKIVVTADLAFTTNQRSDDSAFPIVAIDKDENKYVLDIIYGRFSTYEIVDKFKDIINKYNPVSIGVESANGGAVIINMLEKELAGMKNFCGITVLKTGGMKKADRIINKLQLPYKRGEIFHLNEGEYVDDLEYQILSVTRDNIKSLHDDLVDALSYVYDIADETHIYNSTYEGDESFYDEYYIPSTYIF